MKNRNGKAKIVFIISSSHSGSTLLDMIIGGHSLSFSLGEIIHFFREFNIGNICACGVPIRECKFWLKVLIDITDYSNKLNLNICDNEFENLSIQLEKRDKIYLFLPRFVLEKKYLENGKLKVLNKIYNYVLKHSGKDILIDSSKNLWRPVLFKKLFPDEYDYYVVHLIRDGRGVLYSNMKDYYKVEFMGEKLFKRPKILAPEFVIKAWIKTNLISLIVLKIIFKHNYLIVKYENICNNPKIELEKIVNLLGIDYQEDMINFPNIVHHNIAGNPTRYSKSGLRKVDDEWRNNLSPDLIIKFNKKAGWLNNFFYGTK